MRNHLDHIYCNQHFNKFVKYQYHFNVFHYNNLNVNKFVKYQYHNGVWTVWISIGRQEFLRLHSPAIA